ncbi:MAG TPA: hypothetical protein VGR89_00645, partial [Puia sp.]|nr:hypothetical protein [Puia sp.]
QNNGGIASFVIYRCESGSCDCTPVGPPSGIPYATVPGNQFSFADTQVNAGDTYTYMVSYVYFDACSQLNETSPPSSSLCAQTCGSGCSSPEVLITGNNANDGNSDDYPPIQTYDFSDGTLVNSFVPSEAMINNNGRALAINGSQMFYAEVPYSSGGPGTSFIDVCPYGTEGSGGGDTSTIANPDTRTDEDGDAAWVSGLAFHVDPATGKNELYALTGYGLYANSDGTVNYPNVYEIDPDTGETLAGPVPIPTPENPADGSYASSDGFLVLPNGDFLINDYDAADGSTTYREYYGFSPPTGVNAGTLRPGGLVVSLANLGPGFSNGAGVTTDGTYLYFMTNVSPSSSPAIVQTTLAGVYVRSQGINNGAIENIGVVILQ